MKKIETTNPEFGHIEAPKKITRRKALPAIALAVSLAVLKLLGCAGPTNLQRCLGEDQGEKERAALNSKRKTCRKWLKARDKMIGEPGDEDYQRKAEQKCAIYGNGIKGVRTMVGLRQREALEGDNPGKDEVCRKAGKALDREFDAFRQREMRGVEGF